MPPSYWGSRMPQLTRTTTTNTAAGPQRLPGLGRQPAVADRHQERRRNDVCGRREGAGGAPGSYDALRQRQGFHGAGHRRHQWQPTAGHDAGRGQAVRFLRRPLGGFGLRDAGGADAAGQRQLDQAVHVAGCGADAGGRARQAACVRGNRPCQGVPGAVLGDAGPAGAARDAMWTELLDAGVDHINTDDLPALEELLSV